MWFIFAQEISAIEFRLKNVFIWRKIYFIWIKSILFNNMSRGKKKKKKETAQQEKILKIKCWQDQKAALSLQSTLEI